MATAYTQDELRSLFQSSFNLKQWYSFLQHFFNASELKERPERIIKDTIDEGYYLGNIDTKDHYHVGFFCYNIRKGSVANKRVGLRNLVKSFINPTWGIFDAALVVFDSGDHWRLSFISDIKGDATSPKRYTYVFGSNELLYKTPIERFRFLQDKGISFENLKTAFSVEALSDEFFDKYREQYADFIQYVTGKRFVKVGNKWEEKLLGEPDAALMQAFNYNEKKIRDYVKKMMGRITFLHFLQRKRWMCGDLNYMQNLFENSKYKNDYLDSVLEPLFFGILNTKPDNREALFTEYGWDKTLLEEWKDIPYLNGGLFERDEDDEPESKFPADYFKRLFQFFSEYNFTIDENDPNDAEIGVDPEMLGHIFENLLEDNKDKGAFYTPKEIVHYMCRQSVIQYLETHEPDEQYVEPIEQLINNGIVMPILQTKDVASRFMILLKEVKVCDPAIGSGAFPMGILYVLYYAIHNLQPHAEPKGSFDSTETKREIIQNNIFGVDIEQGAVDIARLRFWLALVVDADEPQPLPNLDYKITCGNSLLSRYPIDSPIENVFIEYNKGKSESEKMTLSKYKKLVSDYTNTSNHITKENFRRTIENIKNTFKTELTKQEKEKISKLRGRILSLESPMLLGERTRKEKVELKKLKEQLVKQEELQSNIINNKLYTDAFEWRFEFPALLDENGDFTGFDIIIGNPPYLRIQGIRDVNPQFADELVEKYQSATGSFDLYVTFVERGLQIIKQQGIVNYIMPVKWTNAAFGKGLRTIISEKNAAHQIINFGAYQVFNASTYTALQWFMPNSNELLYYELDKNLTTNQELDSYLKSLNNKKASKINANKLTKEAWVLTVGYTTEILGKLENHSRCIGDIFNKIFCGLQTSKDDVYFLYNCTEDNGFITGESKHLNHYVQVERGLVRPLLKGEDVHRYDNIQTNRFVIFPYKIENGKAILYTENELSILFPNGYAYLKECEEELRNREKGRLRNDDFWFKYIYPKNLALFDNEKLVAPEISYGGNFAYDKDGIFYSTTKIYGYIKKKDITEGYKFWMALFNSRLFWFYIQNTGYVLRGGYYTFKTNYVSPFPVPEPQQTRKGAKIVERLTDFLLYLYDKNNVDILTHTSNKRLATHIEEIIDMIFYELYFEQHMKDHQIDVIADLNKYDWSSISDAATIETFYKWYQQSENMVRQKIMLLDTRSNNFIYQIHRTATI